MERPDLVALLSREVRDLARAECRLAARDDGAVGPGDVDDVARRELPCRPGYADGQEAPPLLLEGRDRAGVDRDRARGPLEIGEPALARLERDPARDEERPRAASRKEPGDDVG